MDDKEKEAKIIKLETFTKLINSLQKVQNRSLDLYQNYKLDFMNYEEEYINISELLMKEVFTEEQKDWIDWFCYENDFGEKSLEAWDKEGKLICQNIEQLYELVTNG